MRIISGSAGGLRLQVPDSMARPTLDRVREALFSILGERVCGARVLDLFAGSGALGLEALSRGANRAVLVDHDRRACQAIRHNLALTKLEGARMHQASVQRYLAIAAGREPASFDLVFADPPYCKEGEGSDSAADLLTGDALARLLAPEGVLVLETAHDWRPPATTSWQLRDDRTYGGTRLWWWEQGKGKNADTVPGVAGEEP